MLYVICVHWVAFLDNYLYIIIIVVKIIKQYHENNKKKDNTDNHLHLITQMELSKTSYCFVFDNFCSTYDHKYS